MDTFLCCVKLLQCFLLWWIPFNPKTGYGSSTLPLRISPGHSLFFAYILKLLNINEHFSQVEGRYTLVAIRALSTDQYLSPFAKQIRSTDDPVQSTCIRVSSHRDVTLDRRDLSKAQIESSNAARPTHVFTLDGDNVPFPFNSVGATGGVGDDAVLTLWERTVSANEDVDFQMLSRFFARRFCFLISSSELRISWIRNSLFALRTSFWSLVKRVSMALRPVFSWFLRASGNLRCVRPSLLGASPRPLREARSNSGCDARWLMEGPPCLQEPLDRHSLNTDSKSSGIPSGYTSQ